MKKKFLALFMCMLLLVVPFSQVAAYAEEAATTHTVSTAEELLAAIATINSSADNANHNITLKKSIDLTGKEFTPIAGPYSGTIEGNGHTITGLTIVSDTINQGFIAVATGCKIQNLNFEKASVVAAGYTGVLIATVNPSATVDTEIVNCTINDSIVVGKDSSDNVASVGIMVGNLKKTSDSGLLKIVNSTITNSIARSNEAGDNGVGGFVGNHQAGTSLLVSGCKVIDCYMFCAKQQVGGICGNSRGPVTIENSIVDLDVTKTLTKTVTFKGDSEPTTYTCNPMVDAVSHYDGAILGYYNNTSKTAADVAIIRNCTANATVRATNGRDVGGLVGKAHSAQSIVIENCSGKVAISMTASGSVGLGGIIAHTTTPATITNTTIDVTATAGDGAFVGGAVGYATKAVTITNCVVTGVLNATSSTSQTGGIVGGSTAAVTLNNVVSMADVSAKDASKANAWIVTGTATKNDKCVDNSAKSNLEIADMTATLFDADFAATAKAAVMNHVVSVVGYQTKAAGEKYDIRFVAYVDAADYAAAGMKIAATINGQAKEVTVNAKSLYTSVNAVIGDTTNALTVEKIGNYADGYILAIKVAGVPTGVTNFTVTPFVQTANATVYGAAVNVAVAN